MTEPRRNLPGVSIILTGVGEPEHWRQALDSWLAQDYTGRLELVIVHNLAGLTSCVLELNRAHLVHGSAVFNPALDRNIGHWASNGALLVFASPQALPVTNFITQLVLRWDAGDAFIADAVFQKLPCNPQLHELVVVKRWLNTRVRGFNEGMFAAAHGWGYDDVDYWLRLQACSAAGGCLLSAYPAADVRWLPVTDDMRSAPFTIKDLSASYTAHEQWSQTRLLERWEGNYGAPWGVV